MEEKIKEMKEKVKELEEMLKISYEDIELEPPTPLDRKLITKYQELWSDILEICKNDKIKTMDKFDEKYPIFEDGLENFVKNYSSHLDYCGQMDNALIEFEIKMLQEEMNQFKIEENAKKENELLIIRDKHIIGQKREAEENLKEFIKKYPSEPEAYEIKCTWELDKKKPDMEKVAKILDEAEENETFVPDSDVYEMVIEYFKEIGNDELANYYESLLDFSENDLYDYDENEFFDEDFWDEDFIDEEREEKQELLEELKEVIHDKVEKNKTFEQYIDEKSDDELVTFLGPSMAMETQEKLSEIQNNLREYVIENYNELIKKNLIYMPKTTIAEISKIPSNGIIELNVEKNINEIFEFAKYNLLKQFGIAFAEYKEGKILIHVPEIKEIKKYIKEADFRKQNTEFNEKINVISGIVQVHGAIKTKKIYDLMQEFYGEIAQEKFAKFLIIVCNLLCIAQLKINIKEGKLEFIYHMIIDENQAKKIIKANKELKTYSKQEYIKYSKEDIFKDTKGYKKLEKTVRHDPYILQELEDLIINYVYAKRLGDKNIEKRLDKIIEETKEETKQDLFFTMIMDLDKIKEIIKEIAAELPKWIGE